MKRLSLLLMAWLVLGVACPLIAEDGEGAEEPGKRAAKKKARREKKPKSVVAGEYKIMASVLKFDEKQLAQLETILKEEKQAMAEFNKEHGEKVKELKQAAKDAKKAGDKDAGKKAAEELKSLDAEKKKIASKKAEAVQGLLTAEQKKAWAEFTFSRELMKRFGKAKLDDEQKAKVKALAAENLEAYNAAKDRRAKGKLVGELTKKIHDEILTDEQRESVKRKPRDKKPREGKMGGKKRGGGKKMKADKDADDADGHGEDREAA